MTQSRLFIAHIPLSVANEFVRCYHRHNRPVVSSKFNLGAVDEQGLLRGVAIIGRPVARMLDNGWTLEVTRVAADGCPNACSFLYGAARSATFALGYRRLVTYTLQEESGSSLRGAGWIRVAEIAARGQDWQNRPGRKSQSVIALPKYRWEAVPPKGTKKAPFETITYPWDILREIS